MTRVGFGQGRVTVCLSGDYFAPADVDARIAQLCVQTDFILPYFIFYLYFYVFFVFISFL